MDLPPSGWYPDPYGVPGLLRWWDGSAWTQHTHPDAGPAAASGTDGGGPAVTVRQALAQPTTVQPARVPPIGAQPTTVQPTTVQPAMAQPAMAHPAAMQSAGMQPTRVDQAMLPAAMLPAAMQYGAGGGAPGAGGPVGPRPPFPAAGPGAGNGNGNGTQVLFLGDDAWRAPGGAGPGDRYGYQRVQRQRRIWVASGLAAGTVAALAMIALVVNALGQTSAPPAATQSPAATTPVAAATSPASASPTASPTTAGLMLTDGQSGLSYTQLGSPWQPSCPGALNNQNFTWTAGESAVAGQVNGGQTTWYGTACSGPLPQQYGYSGVADLESVTNQLVNQFGSYYSGLSATYQQEVSQPIQVSGHAAWEIKFLVTYTNPQGQGLSWTNELGAVVVADTGTGGTPAVFYASIPGNLGESNVDTLVSSLQLSAPQSGGSPAA